MSCLYKIFSPDTSLKVSQKWYEIGIYLFKGSSLWESSAIQTILLETNSIDKRKRMITCKIAVLTLSSSHYSEVTLTYADFCIILPSFHTDTKSLVGCYNGSWNIDCVKEVISLR